MTISAFPFAYANKDNSHSELGPPPSDLTNFNSLFKDCISKHSNISSIQIWGEHNPAQNTFHAEQLLPTLLESESEIRKSLSRVWLFVTQWTIQSMEFSRPEYWSG